MKQRLQKMIATGGICSRREAERLIAAGEVSVNGATVRRPGILVDSTEDRVQVHGRLVRSSRPKLYVALNKPRGCVTTWKDPEGRPTVRELVADIKDRLFPVGRLDYNAEGLILMTNDGEMAYALMRPGGVAKTYRVKVKGTPSQESLTRLRHGLVLDGAPLLPVAVHVESRGDASWLRVGLHEGRKNQIVRMMQAIGHPVRRLRRVGIGPLQLGTLPSGRWRPLEPPEVDALRKAVGTRAPQSERAARRGPAAARGAIPRRATRSGRAAPS